MLQHRAAGDTGRSSPFRFIATTFVAVAIGSTAIATWPTRCLAQSGAMGPYVVFHGLETDEPGENRLRIFRIPVTITLRKWTNERMGIRLRLEGTFVSADPLQDFDQFLEDIQVVNILPGFEFVFPVGEYHKLKPFANLGLGTNTATDNVNLLGDLGMRTEFLFPAKRFVFGLEPGIKISGNTGEMIDNNVELNSFLTFTTLHTINYRVAGLLPDAGVYFEAGYDNLALEFSSITVSRGTFATRYEAGISVGFSHGRPRIGPFAVPRLRIGYRFGDVTGIRFRLGGDWLTVLSEPL